MQPSQVIVVAVIPAAVADEDEGSVEEESVAAADNGAATNAATEATNRAQRAAARAANTAQGPDDAYTGPKAKLTRKSKTDKTKEKNVNETAEEAKVGATRSDSCIS